MRVRAVLITLAGAMGATVANANRDFEMVIKVDRCQGITRPPRYISEEEQAKNITVPTVYGGVFLEQVPKTSPEWVNSNSFASAAHVGANPNFFSSAGDNFFAIRFHTPLPENIRARVLIYHVENLSRLKQIGNGTLALPTEQQHLDWTPESGANFGIGRFGSEQEIPIYDEEDKVQRGTCFLSVRINALDCLPGEELVESQCHQCGAGKFSTDGLSGCQPCKEGHYGSGATYATEETCDGKCSEGYFCPLGSSSSTANKCSDGNDPEFFCPSGVAIPKKVRTGHYTVPVQSTLKSAEEPCQPGHMCVDGVQIPCPKGTYQDKAGQSSCKPCGCEKNFFVDQCGGNSRGTCKECALVSQEFCPAGTFFSGCSGMEESDVSLCLSCSNYTLVGNNTDAHSFANGTASTAQDDLYNAKCGSYTSSTTVNGIPAWVIAVVASVLVLFFSGILYCIVRKRRQMKARMEELDRQNKSLENDHDLVLTMNTNVNPMFTKVNPDKTRELEQMHNEELEEISKHKRALEDEILRLKKEAQQNEIDKSTKTNRTSGQTRARKKEFQGDLTNV